jgi:predicted ArsR family transcriptional regulator
VKIQATPLDAGAIRTRDAVARLILERGPQTAAALAAALNLSPAAVRRHLDALTADRLVTESDRRPLRRRGRGRPARAYALTDSGRAAFPHAYDDLATTALRYLRETGGEAAVANFARHRAHALEAAIRPTVPAGSPRAQRVTALADALTDHGYAASTEQTGTGVQLCQHHCPVGHVAAEFPELCEAETRAFERVLGTYVQRLATIAHGDGVCTTYVPEPPDTAPHPTPSRSGRTTS